MDGGPLPLPASVEEALRRGQLRQVESRFWLPRPRPEVYAYFADARNLQFMTPSWLDFRIRTSMPVAMGVGTEIDYRMGWHGLPIPWRSRITEWQPPLVFTYEQARGPYRRFLHEHRYLEEKRGGVTGTLVVDRAWWSAWGGFLLTPLIERDLNRIFAHREQAMLRVFKPRLGSAEE